jgi:hypothetical protein
MTMDPSDHPRNEQTWGSTTSTTEQVRRFGPPAVIALAALLFVLQNTNSTKFEFLWFDFSMPLWVMLLVFAGVGAIVFYGVQRRQRRRRELDGS